MSENRRSTHKRLRGVDKNIFGVRVNDDSMAPILSVGNTAWVYPSEPLSNGCVCLATWPDGKRLIKRYFKYGDKIVLRSEKGGEDEIALDSQRDNEIRIYRIKGISKEI